MIEVISYPITLHGAVDEVRMNSYNQLAQELVGRLSNLLDAGYHIVVQQPYTTSNGTSLLLMLHRPPELAEAPERTVIQEALRAYQSPPQGTVAGEHPDTARLRAMVGALIKSGVLPEEPPVDDEATERLIPVGKGDTP